VGSRGKAPGQGVKPETLWAWAMDTANLLPVLKFGNLTNEIFRLFLQKRSLIESSCVTVHCELIKQ